MELHILLAGVEFGPYTDHQARDLIGEGFLSETDPAKRLDETAWLPLSEVLAQPRAGTLTEGPTAEEIPATEPEPAPSIVDPVAEEEPAAEPPPVFDWPVPEESEETVAPETSPASAPEEATATVPEPEPPAPAALAEPAPILIPPLTPSRRTAVTRELSAAEKTSFQMPVTKPLPAITPGRAPTLEPPRAPASLPAAARTTAPILSTTPLLQVSLPARNASCASSEPVRCSRRTRCGPRAPNRALFCPAECRRKQSHRHNPRRRRWSSERKLPRHQRRLRKRPPYAGSRPFFYAAAKKRRRCPRHRN
jgi:hypothetical protein